MQTLAQLKASTIPNIAGVNPQDPQFIAYVNEAAQTLIDLGDWWATVVSVRGLVVGGCMTWPHKVDAVLAINLNGRSEKLANYWYSFVPVNSQFAGLMRETDIYLEWGNGRHGRNAVEFSGTQAMFAGPSPQNPFQIQVTADNPADYGMAVTIYGLDASGQELFSNQFDGTQNAVVPQRGVRMVLAALAPVTPSQVSVVTSVTKDITVGDVKAWYYAAPPAIPASLTMIASWRGSQTSPEFLYSRIPGADCNRIYCLEALVKLGFEPVAQDSDICVIGNEAALKSMIQAIKRREAGDDAGADKYEQTAIRRLNMELNNRMPVEQFVAENATFNGVDMSRRTRIY